MPKVSIIIPSFNEAKNINLLLDGFGFLQKKKYEIIIVDDGSTDNTSKVVSKFKHAKLVRSMKNEGKGHAIQLGAAIARGKIIVIMDADNSHDPRDILKMVSIIEKKEADFVNGSRYLGGSADHTIHRAAINILLSAFCSLLFNKRLTDVLNGFKAFRRELVKTTSSRGFEIEIELVAKCLRAGYHIREVPIYESKRLYGHSKLSPIRDGQKILSRIIKERARGGF